ncbi:hypothetical protein [Mesoterricola sediminis]|uniref:PilZ domain-containing protein n=1 Tax=Mesoterricola sediminis TaxID=2927980 RepID=A0AA48KE60_9BACT|nr:hypothetical protein [Mesoterricola sediminis]BDU77017.1 hypothetical protein METESE_19750 [Mesoterricola sediminis]
MEKRRYPRTSLISDTSSSFSLGGQTYANVHVTNIGTRGCCLRLPASTAPSLRSRPNLDNLVILQAGSRRYAMKGRIAWVAEPRAPADAFLQAGVEFTEDPEDCAPEVTEYLDANRVK